MCRDYTIGNCCSEIGRTRLMFKQHCISIFTSYFINTFLKLRRGHNINKLYLYHVNNQIQRFYADMIFLVIIGTAADNNYAICIKIH